MRLNESTNRDSSYVSQWQVRFFSSGERSHEKCKPRVEVGDGLSIEGLFLRRLLTMMAVSPADGTDPVGVAFRNLPRFLSHHSASETGIPREDFDSAEDRRYSLARVHGPQRTRDSPVEKAVIIRDDLESTMNVAKPSHQDRALLRKNARMTGSRGYHHLAVASITMGGNGELGAFRIEGFINIHPIGTGLQDGDLISVPDDWMRLRLRSIGLRFLYRLNVVLVVPLLVTGCCIVNPFFGGTFFRGIKTGFLTGWMRFIHFSCEFIWIAVGLTRAFIAFSSKDRYTRWETFQPIHSEKDMKNLGHTLGSYTFLRKGGPLYATHNPLQQLAYTSIYIVGTLQILIGPSLYVLYHMSNPVWASIALSYSWFEVPIMRLLHVMIMFLLWWLMIAHIYLVLRADSSERHGGVSATISDGVWIRYTSRPVDAPELQGVCYAGS